MLFQSNFDCETVALMGRVCDEARRDLQLTTFFPHPRDSAEVLEAMAGRIIAALSDGERDPTR